MKKVVILGGGITGLYLAYRLTQEKEYDVTLLERNNHVGGICASFAKDGITFDYGPHKIYTTIPGVLDEYKKILGNDMLTIKKKNSLRLLGKYFEFPVKIQQVVLGIPFFIGVRCGMSYGTSLLKKIFSSQQPQTYEEYFLQGFGRVGYNLLFRDYAEKVWGDPQMLSEELARKRIPVPSILSLLANMVKKQNPSVSADYFYYPRKGFGQLTEILHNKIIAQGGKIILEANITAMTSQERMIKSITYVHKKKEKKITADIVISTIHITDIPSFFSPSQQVREAANQLHHRGLILVYLIVQKERLFQENWLFFPEREYIFNRVSEQKSFSTETMPKDKTVIIAEVTATPDDEQWSMDEKALLDLVIRDLKKADILHDEKILDAFTKRARRIYPIYAVGYKSHLQTLLNFVHSFDNLYTLGRQGLFNYNNTDHCIDMGRKMADHLLQNKTKEDWQKTIAYFDTYRIVD